MEDLSTLFKVTDRVEVIDSDYNVRVGEIVALTGSEFDEERVALVEFPDGSKEKWSTDSLTRVEEKAPETEPKPKSKALPDMNKTITISLGEFIQKSSKVVTEYFKSEKDARAALVMTLTFSLLTSELFKDE